nr:hypothetical protein [Tanacetum cinerariifolium]
MLAIPDEHLLKFHACKDAKSLWEAIKNRFRGKKESKKMQKTILKQNYENFVASSQEGLDKTYDRFQKLISQLETHGEVISQDDANLKLLRSLPSAWNNIALIMRNKSDLDILSMDDLYNNLKVHKEDRKEARLNGKETVGFDKTMVECYNFHRRCHFARECRAQRNQGNRNRDAPTRNAPVDTSTTNALVVQDGIGYQMRLESLEAEIDVHEKNEVVYEEDIAFLKYDIQGNPQNALQNKGIFDSGCARHMTGNKYYLTDYQEINGGFVAFRGNAKGGFLAQSLGSSNIEVLDSPCLLVFITGMSQSRQHVITRSIHIESCNSPTKSLFDVGSSRISIFTVSTFISLECSGKLSRKMRRTLYYNL